MIQSAKGRGDLLALFASLGRGFDRQGQTLENLGYRVFVHMHESLLAGVHLKKRPGKWNWDHEIDRVKGASTRKSPDDEGRLLKQIFSAQPVDNGAGGFAAVHGVEMQPDWIVL